MAPTFVASYNLVTSAEDTSTLTTPAFTPANGEVLVVKLSTWTAGTPMSAPTGGGQTFTKRAESVVGGFRPYVAIYTAVVAGSPGSTTIASTPAATSWHSMVVERWSGAQLAATPVANAAQGQGVPAASSVGGLTAGSVWSWVATDAQSIDPTTRAYLGAATEELCDDQHVKLDGVAYYAYQTAAGGTNAYGLSAPTGNMQWWIAGVEIQAAAGGAMIAPDGVSVPVALGSPALSDGSMAVAPAGISVPVALGAPTLAWSATVAPDGVQVPVAVGSPTVGAVPVAPDGIAVPVTLGAPTLSWSGSISPAGIAVAVTLGAPSLTIPGATVIRPNTGLVARPNTGLAARPNTGTVTRP